MALTLHRYDDVDAFLHASGAFLAEREAENNLIFGICSWLRGNSSRIDEAPAFLAVTDDNGDVVAASLQMPPNNPVLSATDDLEAIDMLADAYGADAPGVLGAPEAARRFAAEWAARTGGSTRVAMAERIFRLERVIPPRPTSGAWRLIETSDADLLAEWLIAFVVEATPETPPTLDEAVAAIGRWARQEGTFAYVWEDGGEIVSLAAARGETPNGIRIGPVYTPPQHRGRGYASAVTAAASQDQLDRGRRFCFLFTDLANPTSNKIYQAIGYQPVCDVDMYLFETDA